MGDRPVGVAFRTLGCKVNRVESDDFAAELLGRGCVLVPDDEAAVIVVNTCTVTGEADAKARKAVRQSLNAASSPVVVVTGCLASLDAPGLESLGDRVVVEADKPRVAERVAELLELRSQPATRAVRAGDGFRTRAMLKVQDGCDCFCTYCIVPHARGVPRSVPASAVLDDVRGLLEAGVGEIVFTGINLGRYEDGSTDLAGLVEAVAAEGVGRIRLSSIEPRDLSGGLLEVLASVPAACEHVHVPLQSGSDTVLRAMGRPYTMQEFIDIVAAARSAVPGLAVTTDVIAGFPGETHADAEATLRLCEQIGFSRLHVFRYSERAGTPAATLDSPVPKEVRAERAAALRELDAELRRRFEASRRGSEVELLVERIADGIAEGTTREYLRLSVPAEGLCAGSTVRVVYR